jgi:diacylglycerol kinase
MIGDLLRRFKFCCEGLAHAVKTETNMRWHLAAAIVVVAAAFWFQLSSVEMALIALCTGGVFAAECFNTAVERLANRVTTETDPLIKQAKDTAAAAVFCMALASVVVALFVFWPKLFG